MLHTRLLAIQFLTADYHYSLKTHFMTNKVKPLKSLPSLGNSILNQPVNKWQGLLRSPQHFSLPH